ncbi:TetR/AcrR family transcriptional regulator [Alkalihalobacillus sp. BA299]|uniref:TetR/AcrR family transcriptional regulator n=1 Tax=Alkalihalobacillus sp. BA299 TaxID=2815938 RepID=UPI001ADD362B|nr:TetR/AcrR family transcriptional regulator [Alkalihalobacillus sp. BA299]
MMKLSEMKIIKKKEQILASAIDIINRRGYSGATMEEIAAELLMTKGSLYYYFKNKSDLMYQCHNFVLSQAIEELERILNGNGSVKEILHKMVAAHIEYAVEDKETFNIIMEPKRFYKREQVHLVLKLRKSYENLFAQIISRGIESGEFTAKEPSIARMIILGAMNWIQQWYKPDGKLSKEQLTDLYSEYVIKILK